MVVFGVFWMVLFGLYGPLLDFPRVFFYGDLREESGVVLEVGFGSLYSLSRGFSIWWFCQGFYMVLFRPGFSRLLR